MGRTPLDRRNEQQTLLVLAFLTICFIVFVVSVGEPWAQAHLENLRNPKRLARSDAGPAPSPIIKDFEWVHNEDASHIKGTVTNNSGHRIRYANINYALFDREGRRIGTASAGITDWASGEEWRFKAPVRNDEAVECKFVELSGW